MAARVLALGPRLKHEAAGLRSLRVLDAEVVEGVEGRFLRLRSLESFGELCRLGFREARRVLDPSSALRGHLFEYGYIFPQGINHVADLVTVVEDRQSCLPESMRSILQLLVDTFTALEAQITALDTEINRRSKADPMARRLMTIPGVGPIVSTAITALVPAAQGFRAGRDFAAWLGLTPVQKSTGGKQKLGAVSKRGERTIRRLLIIGASAVVRHARRGRVPEGSWLAQMLARKPKMLVIVALANKIARIVWALLVKGGVYRAPVSAA